MKQLNRFLICIILLIVSKHCFSQIKDINSINYGIPLEIEIDLPNKYNHIVEIKLEKLPKKLARGYYNQYNDKKLDTLFVSLENAVIKWEKKLGMDSSYIVNVPPLKPNHFYRIVVSYLSSESMFATYLMLSDEGINKWHTKKKEWMKMLERISKRKYPFTITHDPEVIEFYSFKIAIESIDLNIFDKEIHDLIDTTNISLEELKKKKEGFKTKKEKVAKNLKDLLIKEFQILKFKEAQDRVSNDHVIQFSKWVKQTNSFNNDNISEFSSQIIDFTDYLNVFEFYEKNLLRLFKDGDIKGRKLIDSIASRIELEKSQYKNDELIPNHLKHLDTLIIKNKKPISTFASTFETAYKLSLVPDFGYIGYLDSSGSSPNGGNLFLGVNVSLSPSNKNVPLQISDLTLMQRLALHTGVTIGSIKKDNIRDNFFGEYSLLLGGSYKVFTQGTRVNFGGLFYKKIDTIDGGKSVAVQPYIGLSIDLEIKKWMNSVFPNLKL